MEIDITKLSSKGQIVIPAGMRKGFIEGEKLIVFRDQNRIILKKAREMDEQMKEDLEFARRTEEAWKEVDKGNYKEYSVEEFLQRLKK